MTAYVVPDDPSDPEAAALELIVRLPALPTVVFDHDWTCDALQDFTGLLQDFAGLLSAEDVFAGMTWHDAKHAAVAIAFDATNRDDSAEFLRQRANMVATGADRMSWDNPDAMVRAFMSAAMLLELGLPAGDAR